MTDKNMKFSAKCVHCNPWFMRNIYLNVKFIILTTHFVQCIKNVQSLQFCMILFRMNESNA